MTNIDFSKPFRLRQAAVVGSQLIEAGVYTSDRLGMEVVTKIPPALLIQDATANQVANESKPQPQLQPQPQPQAVTQPQPQSQPQQQI